MHVEAIYVSPVKSLALNRVERAELGAAGIAGDRRFYLVDDSGRLATQRQCGRLARVVAASDADGSELRLTFPDGRIVDGAVRAGERVTTRFFGYKDVAGDVVEGAWSEALSSYAGMPLRLVRAVEPGAAFDGFPVSLCSAESVDAFRAAAGVTRVDERRFRPNFYVAGAGPHGEDAWIGRTVRIGAAAVKVRMRDPRCVITTLDPSSGERDLDSLKLIASYRKDQQKEVNFGVYATVSEPGIVAVGDEVSPEGL